MLVSNPFSRATPLVIAASVLLVLADQAVAQAPRFRADGRDADAYGKFEGYPSCAGAAYLGEQRCLIGALSDFDTRRTISDYACEKLWEPLGAEAEATWSMDVVLVQTAARSGSDWAADQELLALWEAVTSQLR